MSLYFGSYAPLLKDSISFMRLACSPSLSLCAYVQRVCDLLRWHVAPSTCSLLVSKFNFSRPIFPPLFVDTQLFFSPVNIGVYLMKCSLNLSTEMLPNYVHMPLVCVPLRVHLSLVYSNLFPQELASHLSRNLHLAKPILILASSSLLLSCISSIHGVSIISSKTPSQKVGSSCGIMSLG